VDVLKSERHLALFTNASAFRTALSGAGESLMVPLIFIFAGHVCQHRKARAFEAHAESAGFPLFGSLWLLRGRARVPVLQPLAVVSQFFEVI